VPSLLEHPQHGAFDPRRGTEFGDAGGRFGGVRGRSRANRASPRHVPLGDRPKAAIEFVRSAFRDLTLVG
jgi:hypothetical protein